MKPLGAMWQPRKKRTISWYCLTGIVAIGLPSVALSQSLPAPDPPFQLPAAVTPFETPPAPPPDAGLPVAPALSDPAKVQMAPTTR
ncbi:MAG: hypothetical protein ACK43N_12240, partial [Pirellulaceae bacterium]